MSATRRTFAHTAVGATIAAATTDAAPAKPLSPRILVVVAHPDDEYHFAVTLYRFVREMGGIVDQLIITNGAGGDQYSRIAEHFYNRFWQFELGCPKAELLTRELFTRLEQRV